MADTEAIIRVMRSGYDRLFDLVGAGVESLAQSAAAWTVKIHAERGANGSGIVWAPDGQIVTNAHVAFRSPLSVELADGRLLEGIVTRRDPRCDLAEVRIDAGDLATVSFRDSDTVRVGELVVAAGNPFAFSNALTLGVVHAKPSSSQGGGMGMIQADLRLAPGFSGGPMLDASGRLIGINTMVAGGLGLAVSSNAVRKFLAVTVPPSLGVELQIVRLVTPGDGFVRPALIVTEVMRNNPAHNAGVMVGDIILAANGNVIRDHVSLTDVLAAAPGQVDLVLLRSGREQSISVKIDGLKEQSRAA